MSWDFEDAIDWIGAGVFLFLGLLYGIATIGNRTNYEWSASVSLIDRASRPLVYVAPPPNCSDAWPGMFSFYPKCSIQDAIDAAGSGTVILASGHYKVSKTIQMKSASFIGGLSPGDPPAFLDCDR